MEKYDMKELVTTLKDPAFVYENKEVIKELKNVLSMPNGPADRIPIEEYKKFGLLKNKYNITHSDGSPVHPEAKYFVLRLDDYGRDPIHIDACREAMLTYAGKIKHHLPLLADDIFKDLHNYMIKKSDVKPIKIDGISYMIKPIVTLNYIGRLIGADDSYYKIICTNRPKSWGDEEIANNEPIDLNNPEYGVLHFKCVRK